jgi:HAD superfamily hydrolase (TIGR01509 family)
MDALLLDFNGVIVNDEPLHFASFRAILGEEGITLDESTYYAEYLGMDDRSAFREAMRRADQSTEPAHVQRLVARKALAYARLAAAGLPVVPGVRAFVESAAARGPVAVVSGALREEIDAGLAAAGLTAAIDVVISPADVPTTKPDPAGFQLALRRLEERHRAGAWRAAVIEDSLPGLAAARALGAGCLMLTTSHDAEALSAADAVWQNFTGHEAAELEPLWRAVAAR